MKRTCLTIFILLLFIQQSMALGPVGHMRVVVDNWDAAFEPILHVPISDKDAVIAAVAGALAPDAGYVVDRMQYFTDLAHYIRSGDLATGLVRLAQTPKYSHDKRFLAFALGFSTHYWADRYGHYFATNRLVAELENADIARVVYEHNACHHTWVETQLSVLDIEEAPQILATGFLEYVSGMGGEPNASLKSLYEFLREGIQSVYPAAEIAFTAYDLYRFYRLSTGMLCLTQDVVAFMEPGKSPCPSCGACKGLLSGTGSETGAQSDGSTLARFGRLIRTPLPLSPKLVEDVYGGARQSIRAKLTSRPDLGLENFNLDTNLPSRAGQYQCADSAFRKAATQAKSLNASSADQKQAVKDFAGAFDAYMKGGDEVRALFGGEFSTPTQKQVQSELPTYLFDIYPLSPSMQTLKVVQAKDCRSKTSLYFKMGQTTFFLRPGDHTICTSDPIRTIDALYAQLAAGRILDQASQGRIVDLKTVDEFVAPKKRDYAEAIDRLRLGSGEDLDSGLYKEHPCPTCVDLRDLP